MKRRMRWLVKTVRFVNGNKHKDVILKNDSCEFPIDIMGSVVEVGVFAGDLKSTTSSYVVFLPSILEHFGIPVDPTPEVYMQVMRLIQEIKNDIEEDNEDDMEALSNADLEDILRNL